MRKSAYSDQEHTRDNGELTLATAAATGALPNRLLTAFEVAEFVGCHEETVRRAYLRGLLTSQRFGVQRTAVSSGGRPRLDSARRTNTSLVDHRKERSMKEDP